MITSYHRPTKAVIHTEAIKENVANEVKRLPEGKELFAVVKADGYGHGAIETAHAAVSGGAKGFCVATVDEGMQLREAGFTQTILILGVVDSQSLLQALDYHLSITVATLEWFESAEKVLMQRQGSAKKLQVHIKIDSGMGRIGFTNKRSLLQAVQKVILHPQMEWEGIFTHFATADTSDTSYWEQQKATFTQMIDVLPERPRYVHISNSATSLWHEENIGNMVRYGIAMYGLNPSGGELEAAYPLKPALELISELSQVKKAASGTNIGYGATYTTSQEEWIGTVPIGYADGWIRHLQGFSVLVNGEYCEIIGRICMDQIMIRLPRDYPAGTKVTLIGKSGEKVISMQDVADYLDTIHYEVACMISDRVPREYKK